ncbi:thioesterase II family protein [Streptomyces sp. NPDC058000]|uniref:thioesterase II family protein n=1 Tax=Streptomyces sp. NPDC058000 TaxID=3346299 RepID=UPI0036E05CAB
MTTGTGSDTWVRRFRLAPGAPVRLVCFPHAGGAASFFHPLARQLSPDVEVLPVQYPGRQDRRHEPPLTDIGLLAAHLATELSAVLDEGPTAFFGHSMGATVAFETVRRLEREGRGDPLMLFASGRRAPGLARTERVHLLDDAGLLAELRELDGTGGALLDDPEVVRAVLPALRADYRAIETYRCTPPDAVVHCPVTALTGRADPRVSVADARAWVRHTTGPFRLRTFDGGHFYLGSEVRPVADVVRASVRARSA